MVFENDVLDLKIDTLTLEDNQPYDYIYVTRKQPGAVIVPYFSDTDSVLLVSQYRHPVSKVAWGFPGGGIESDQTAEETARKELLEETGYEAKELLDLGQYLPDMGIIGNTKGQVFLALDPVKVGESAQDTAEESTEPQIFPLEKVKQMISEGEIRDGWTLGPWSIFLLWLEKNGTKENGHGENS